MSLLRDGAYLPLPPPAHHCVPSLRSRRRKRARTHPKPPKGGEGGGSIGLLSIGWKRRCNERSHVVAIARLVTITPPPPPPPTRRLTKAGHCHAQWPDRMLLVGAPIRSRALARVRSNLIQSNPDRIRLSLLLFLLLLSPPSSSSSSSNSRPDGSNSLSVTAHPANKRESVQFQLESAG